MKFALDKEFLKSLFFQAGCQYSDCSIGRGYYGSSCGLRAGFNYGGPSGRGGNSLCGATGKFFTMSTEFDKKYQNEAKLVPITKCALIFSSDSLNVRK